MRAGCSADFGPLGWLLSLLPRGVRIVLLHGFGNHAGPEILFVHGSIAADDKGHCSVHPVLSTRSPRAARPIVPSNPGGIKNADAFCSSRRQTKIEGSPDDA